MNFEYDPNKSASNHEKHGIDFKAAKALWSDLKLLKFEVDYEVEPRFLMIGKIAAKHWSAVITLRGESIRIISVRRSRVKEIDLYENQI